MEEMEQTLDNQRLEDSDQQRRVKRTWQDELDGPSET